MPEAALKGLREIDNVRPLTDIPAWIEGLLRHTTHDRTTARDVKAVWDGLVKDFLKVPFVSEHDRWSLRRDEVDKLEVGLRISKGLSLGLLTKLTLGRDQKQRQESYIGHALEEDAFKSNRADYIIYGHTHYWEIAPLDRIPIGERIARQFYFNSGTWRRVFRLARYEREQLKFLDYNVMTYLAFFKEDERKGRPFESWTGTLSVNPAERRA